MAETVPEDVGVGGILITSSRALKKGIISSCTASAEWEKYQFLRRI